MRTCPSSRCRATTLPKPAIGLRPNRAVSATAISGDEDDAAVGPGCITPSAPKAGTRGTKRTKGGLGTVQCCVHQTITDCRDEKSDERFHLDFLNVLRRLLALARHRSDRDAAREQRRQAAPCRVSLGDDSCRPPRTTSLWTRDRGRAHRCRHRPVADPTAVGCQVARRRCL